MIEIRGLERSLGDEERFNKAHQMLEDDKVETAVAAINHRRAFSAINNKILTTTQQNSRKDIYV